jgi:hypothetical protein
LRLIITQHAYVQMAARGISKDQVIIALKMGSKVKQTDGFKAIYSYYGICFRMKGDTCIIKTVTHE